MFGRNKHTTTAAPVQQTTTTKRSSGMFGRRRSSSPDLHHNRHSTHATTSPTHGTGLLHRNHEDASIGAARERVMRAETAERDADRALVAAKAAVHQARAEVKRIELEAAEEARLAKIKQGQAASLSKRGKMLGRHDHH